MKLVQKYLNENVLQNIDKLMNLNKKAQQESSLSFLQVAIRF